MADVTHEPAKKALGSIRQLSADGEAQRLAEAREWGRINWNLSVGAARREGVKQGLEQGLERGRELGLEQGLEQGRELGLELGRVEALRITHYTLSLPSCSISALAHCLTGRRMIWRPQVADQLNAWTGGVLSAGSLEELLGRPG